ncbi:hypothetical protein R3X27_01790 [Tropicimonas sp. TH_r6]|uniref:hypothetical protein n=1 Tax=Tropicimonas sp. TH_r6 TaxID=3082085 RepID=UPI002953CE28|nr:hypothetical protein [Tropicimonas sp. TH_r6]MDV7141406.1 hypothetical protein [Tropicimonas sp. TH_r6]
MTKRKIILHVGQSKAGSTSIQNYLEQQHDRLAEQGVLFPTSVLARQNPFDKERTPGHRKLLTDIENGDVSAFEAEVARHDPHTLILSVEGLFSDMPADTLHMLRTFFADDDIELVAVLRPQLDWLRSRYVEDVVTGFKSAFTKPFAEYARDTYEDQTLSYRKRLKVLEQTFEATKVSAIALVQGERPLVPRFMEAIGLPVTDAELARGIHANHREKPAALIEAKRRLNTMTRTLETRERLELEKFLRDMAAELAEDLDGSDEDALQWKVPYTDSEFDTLVSGNSALHREGVLDTPLPIGDPGTGDPALGPKARAAMEHLFACGLSDAIEIAGRAEEPKRFRGSALELTQEDATLILSAVRQARVSLHLNAPVTALLAACVDDGLVNLILYPGAAHYRQIAQLEQLDTASPLAAVAIPSAEVSFLRRCLDRLGVVTPDLIVVGGKTTLRPLKLALEKIKPAYLLLVDEATERLPDLLLDGYDVQHANRCLLLRRHSPE